MPALLLATTLCGVAQANPLATTPEATPAPPPSAAAELSAAELEKLALPIALHPDPLIAVVLPASVYPVEIVQAARFVKDTNNPDAEADPQPFHGYLFKILKRQGKHAPGGAYNYCTRLIKLETKLGLTR